MADLWKERKKPVPVSFLDITCGGNTNVSILFLVNLEPGSSREPEPNVCWASSKWAKTFKNSVIELFERYKEVTKNNGVLTWDKVKKIGLNIYFYFRMTNLL